MHKSKMEGYPTHDKLKSIVLDDDIAVSAVLQQCGLQEDVVFKLVEKYDLEELQFVLSLASHAVLLAIHRDKIRNREEVFSRKIMYIGVEEISEKAKVSNVVCSKQLGEVLYNVQYLDYTSDAKNPEAKETKLSYPNLNNMIDWLEVLNRSQLKFQYRGAVATSGYMLNVVKTMECCKRDDQMLKMMNTKKFPDRLYNSINLSSRMIEDDKVLMSYSKEIVKASNIQLFHSACFPTQVNSYDKHMGINNTIFKDLPSIRKGNDGFGYGAIISRGLEYSRDQSYMVRWQAILGSIPGELLKRVVILKPQELNMEYYSTRDIRILSHSYTNLSDKMSIMNVQDGDIVLLDPLYTMLNLPDSKNDLDMDSQIAYYKQNHSIGYLVYAKINADASVSIEETNRVAAPFIMHKPVYFVLPFEFEPYIGGWLSNSDGNLVDQKFNMSFQPGSGRAAISVGNPYGVLLVSNMLRNLYYTGKIPQGLNSVGVIMGLFAIKTYYNELLGVQSEQLRDVAKRMLMSVLRYHSLYLNLYYESANKTDMQIAQRYNDVPDMMASSVVTNIDLFFDYYISFNDLLEFGVANIISSQSRRLQRASQPVVVSREFVGYDAGGGMFNYPLSGSSAHVMNFCIPTKFPEYVSDYSGGEYPKLVVSKSPDELNETKQIRDHETIKRYLVNHDNPTTTGWRKAKEDLTRDREKRLSQNMLRANVKAKNKSYGMPKKKWAPKTYDHVSIIT